MSQPYVGEIRAFGFNFAPRDWAFCNGQLMSIAQNTALYTILGTTYGGDGSQTFALPNLQGQIPMHWGTGSGGMTTQIGQIQGQTTVTLNVNQIPNHNHTIVAVDGTAGEKSVSPNNTSFLTASKGGQVYQKVPVTPNATFSPKAISTAGSSQPHDNMQPYLALNFSISLYGIYPSRN